MQPSSPAQAGISGQTQEGPRLRGDDAFEGAPWLISTSS